MLPTWLTSIAVVRIRITLFRNKHPTKQLRFTDKFTGWRRRFEASSEIYSGADTTPDTVGAGSGPYEAPDRYGIGKFTERIRYVNVTYFILFYFFSL